jgi:hypothetical protein
VSSADAKVPTFTVVPSNGNCTGWSGAATLNNACPTLDLIGGLAATTTNAFSGTSQFTLAGGVTTAVPAVTITNANSTSNNASIALSVATSGTSTAAIPFVVNQGGSSTGDIADFRNSGTTYVALNKTGITIPTGAGLTEATTAKIGYDTTANIYHFGVSSADAKVPTFTVVPSNGNCAGWSGAATLNNVCPTLDLIGGLAATTTNAFSGTSQFTLAGGVTTAVPAVTITNANSTNNNASTALTVSTTGSSTGAIPLVVNQGSSSTGDIADFQNSGTTYVALNKTGITIPTGAGLTEATTAKIGYDTTANIYHFGVSSADAKVPTFTVVPSNGNCAGWSGAATLNNVCPTLDLIGGLAATTTNAFSGTSQFTLAGGVTTAVPAVTITNANSTNNNASTALTVSTTGSSTGAIPLVVNQGSSSTGDIADFQHNGTTEASISTAGFLASQNTVRLSSNFMTANNTNLQTFLSWTLPASGTLTYNFVCNGAYSIASSNVAVAFGIQAATANPTNIFSTGTMFISKVALGTGTLTTLSNMTATPIVSETPTITVGTVMVFSLAGQIENPAATANTINIMVETANGSDQVTVYRGTSCFFTP